MSGIDAFEAQAMQAEFFSLLERENRILRAELKEAQEAVFDFFAYHEALECIFSRFGDYHVDGGLIKKYRGTYNKARNAKMQAVYDQISELEAKAKVIIERIGKTANHTLEENVAPEYLEDWKKLKELQVNINNLVKETLK